MKRSKRPEPAPKPIAAALTVDERTAVLSACETNRAAAGPLMPVLHAVQRSLGFVPKDAVSLIAHELNLSVAEVHGVVTFYHYFRQERPGRHVVHLCRAEACQSLGAADLETHAKRRLGIDFHETTADGMVSLEPVYCLGNCALGPAIMLDEQLKGRVSAARFDQLMGELREAKA